jgi:hypothetical protein
MELVDQLYKEKFAGKDSVTIPELKAGAKLARSECIPQLDVMLGMFLTQVSLYRLWLSRSRHPKDSEQRKGPKN